MIDQTVKKPTRLPVFDDLFENAPCGYVVLDHRGVISMVNTTLLNWLGFDREEIVGRRMTDLLNVASRVFYETHFIPLLTMQGSCDEVALDFRRKDGSVVAVISSAVEARENGNLSFTRVTIFKASQRRQLERSLVKARDTASAAQTDLSARNAALRSTVKRAVSQKREAVREMRLEQETGELREQFIAVLGHDLRNPLAAITAGTRMLARETNSERALKVIQLIDGSVRRMSGLIDNVLDFARGRLGSGIGIDRTTVHLEPIIKQVIDELSAGSPDRQILTRIDLTSVDCDPGRIGQLLSNLVGNALSHGAVDHPIIVKAISRADGDLELSVSNGGEIEPAIMERLFEPFVRGQGKGYQQGLGLGLHIASEIAKAHGGTLAVTSSDLETRFTFRMSSAFDQ